MTDRSCSLQRLLEVAAESEDAIRKEERDDARCCGRNGKEEETKLPLGKVVGCRKAKKKETDGGGNDENGSRAT